MGYDIYLYAEIKRADHWELIGGLEENPEYYPEDYPNAQPLKPVKIYNDRNYDLFAILTGGEVTQRHLAPGQNFESFAPPRGLPKDVCPEIKSWFDFLCDDAFAPSWLSLQEIEGFKWQNAFIRHEAMVDKRVAHLFQDDKSFPYQEWPPDIEISSAAWMRDGVTVRWTNSYADCAGSHFFAALEKLKALGQPSHIRLVFWFIF